MTFCTLAQAGGALLGRLLWRALGDWSYRS